jgi:ParB family chromosome partitioning protein
MDMTPQKPKGRELGRGLSALLGTAGEQTAAPPSGHQPATAPIERLRPSGYQPRRNFAADEIRGLAESIRERGILQPILVRRDPERADGFEIVAGERRWRAAQAAGLHEVPILVRELSDQGVLEVALVENIQRQDLSALEEGEGYRRLIDEFSHTQEGLAKVVGRSRSHIANTLRLLNLPGKVKALLAEGALTAGHARALLNAAAPEQLAERVVKRGLNVRQTERLVQRQRQGAADGGGRIAKDADTIALEQGLTNLLGLKVSIDFRGESGRLVINYRTLEQLDDLLQRLSLMPVIPGPI